MSCFDDLHCARGNTARSKHELPSDDSFERFMCASGLLKK